MLQEALRELNAELEESHIMTEHDLREELELADKRITEVKKLKQEKILTFIYVFYLNFYNF